MSKSNPKGAFSLAINSEGGAPSSFQLLPSGNITGRDGREWNNDNPDAIIAAFNKRGMPLVIDYEHGSEITRGEPAKAAGWVNKLVNKDGEIWADNTEWTKAGEEMVANKEYRFLSPVFIHSKQTRSIKSLESAGLTHQPNLDLKALNKFDPDQPETETSTMKEAQRKALCKKLGLNEEASDEAILQATDTLTDERAKALNKAETPDLTKFVPRPDHDKLKSDLEKAQNKITELTTGTIESAVDEAIAAGKVTPASREFYIKSCNREGGLEEFQKMIGSTPKAEMTKSADTQQKPGDDEAKALNKDQRKILEMQGLDPDDEDLIKEISGKD